MAVIKSCGPRTTSFGVTKEMLDRIDAVLVACEDSSGNVEIIEFAVDRFRQSMIDSRSWSAAGGRVKKICRSLAQQDGSRLCVLKEIELPTISR